MKTNCFDGAARALAVTLLQIGVLPMALLPMAHAAPVMGDQKVAVTQRLLSAASAKPRGIRLRVRSYFRVTNAMDGSRDNEVEMYGVVNFNGRSVWKVAEANAVSATKNAQVEVSQSTFDVIYNKNATSNLSVDGFLRDRDADGREAGGGDPMWNPQKRTLAINIRSLYEEGARKNLNGSYIWQGDRNGESADLIFIISKVSDIN